MARWGFGRGAVLGTLAATLALLVLEPARSGGGLAPAEAGTWVARNLGHSLWAFLLVAGLFAAHLRRLGRLLGADPEPRAVVQLDQLTDVWIHLFVGIGVIWTAVGMRSALEVTLGGPGGGLEASAGTVLERLVDGGILLALTTTIVGALGGYLLRLGKTLAVGAALHDYYAARRTAELRELLAAAKRIEASLQPPQAA